MNISRHFVFRTILNEVRPVELRGKAFPALFFYIYGVGFTNFETPCDVPDTIFRLYLRHFFFFFSNRKKFDLANLNGSRMPPSKWLVKTIPPTFGK